MYCAAVRSRPFKSSRTTWALKVGVYRFRIMFCSLSYFGLLRCPKSWVHYKRSDGLHKLTTRVIRENQVVCVESLAVKNMVRNHSLAKNISDAGWGELVRQLEYKAAWYGRTLVKIDRWNPSSQRCHVCGFINTALTLDVRAWTCPKPECGTHHDRDVNAAKNILAVGLTVNACGETVRPGRAMPDSALPLKQESPGFSHGELSMEYSNISPTSTCIVSRNVLSA